MMREQGKCLEKKSSCHQSPQATNRSFHSISFSERRSNFKKTMDDKEGRRRREETTRQIRKSKKEESLRKRRMGANQAENVAIPSTGSDNGDKKPTKTTNTINDIPELRRILTSTASTNEEVVEATRGLRRILSVERDPPVDEVLNAGVLPNLVRNLIANPSDVPLIFESAWALTNIASTSRTNVVVESEAVGPLIQLLRHENADVREQSAWCLGNIAGDNKEFRDHLLQAGVLEPL
jgi:importin subunit alpha-1